MNNTLNLIDNAPKFDLNLSERYAANWGAWEVAREIVCNAIDTQTSYDLDVSKPNEMIVKTPTVIDLKHALVIGEGTKMVGGETIGQFGEGLKLAALTVVRSGGTIVITSGSKLLTFSMETNPLGAKTLHAKICEYGCSDETTIVVMMPGISAAAKGRFVDPTLTAIKKKKISAPKIYVKGVYITTLESYSSKWDWNINDLPLNRDRSMVNPADVMWRAVHTINQTPSLMRALTKWAVKHPNISEVVMEMGPSWSGTWVHTEAVKVFDEVLANAGVAIRSDSAYQNQCLHNAGINTVDLGYLGAIMALKSKRSVAALMPDAGMWPEADGDFSEQIADIQEALAVVGYEGFDAAKLHIFDDPGASLHGQADMNTRAVHLNARIMGCRADYLGTALHEYAHLQSRAGDESSRFSGLLTKWIGTLASHLLFEMDKKKTVNDIMVGGLS